MKKISFALVLLACGMSSCIGEKVESVAQVLARRKSGYAFDSNKMVSHDQLEKIMEAGQSAPSSYNDQPWAFIVCDKATNPEAYEKALKSLVEFNQKWAQAAPVLIIVTAVTNSRENKFNKWAQYDTGAAAGFMALQAAALGLMAHQMGGFEEAQLRENFNIPKDIMPLSVMAIGYEADNEKKKSVKKERKPINQIFFNGAWGTGV